MAEVQTESHKLNDESKGNRDPNGDQKDNQMSVKDGQPQKLRRFSFQLMAIDSSLPPSGLVLTTSSNDRVRDLRSIQKQLSEVLHKAENAMDYFARDDLAASSSTEKAVDLGGVKDMLQDYERHCNEREKVLFSLDHFFSTSRDDAEFGSSATASEEGDPSKRAIDDYNTQEFTEAMMTARGAAGRLKDLNSELVALAQILKRATLKDLNLENTPLIDLQLIMQTASQSSLAAEAKVVEAQVLFKKLVEVMETSMKDNAVLTKTNQKQEKNLDACLARNASLKIENQQLKVIAKKLEEQLEQQQKEIEPLSVKTQILEADLERFQDVQRVLEETQLHSQSLQAEIDELKSKLEAARLENYHRMVAQEKLEQKQSNAIKSVEEKGIETDDMPFDSNLARPRLIPSFSVSGDDDRGPQEGESKETKRRPEFEEADDKVDLVAENNGLRVNLELSQEKIRNLEEIIRQMYYGRQRQNNGYLLPELPQPKKALTSGRNRYQGAFKRTPTQPKLLNPSQFVDLGQSFPPPPSKSASTLRRGSQLPSSVARMPCIEQLPRRRSFSPLSSDNAPTSLLRIRSVTPRESNATGDYFELQMDNDGNSAVLGTAALARRGSRPLGSVSKGGVGVGSWRGSVAAPSTANERQSPKPDW